VIVLARSNVVVVVAVAGLLAAGCGGAGRSGTGHSGGSPRFGTAPSGAQGRSGVQTVPTPAPTGVPANPAAVQSIREWSTALRQGDLRDAAIWFALPSEIIFRTTANGGLNSEVIRTRSDAELANAELPCGAIFISADQRGRYVNALFRLTDRPGLGGRCGKGTGQTARTNFLMVGGLIVQWIRAPDEPGDQTRSTPPRPAPPPQRPAPLA
jgi:hypothetical protein